MPIITSDERWQLPDGRIVGASEPFTLNERQYLNGVAGLSAAQVQERGIVKMPDVPFGRFGGFVPDPNASPGQWLFDDDTKARVLSVVISEIKAAARAQITAVFPDWKQTNMTARGVELTFALASGATFAKEETAEIDMLNAAWAWIKSIRAHSNDLEAEVKKLDLPDLLKWQPHDWPPIKAA